MGEPVRKASGRTFHPMSTLVSDTCRSSPQVESSHSLKTSNQPPSEALKSGLPMAVFATVKLTTQNTSSTKPEASWDSRLWLDYVCFQNLFQIFNAFRSFPLTSTRISSGNFPSFFFAIELWITAIFSVFIIDLFFNPVWVNQLVYSSNKNHESSIVSGTFEKIPRTMTSSFLSAMTNQTYLKFSPHPSPLPWGERAGWGGP